MSGRRTSEAAAPPPGAGPDETGARWSLGAYRGAVDARLAAWTSSDAAGKVWRKEPSLWPDAPASDVTSRLGWLWAPEQGVASLPELTQFVAEVVEDGIEHVVVLGMGGSSLAPEVLGQILPRARHHPDLTVLDVTHPAAVRAVADRIPADTTLFVVSSKSGTTLEPNAFFRFFWERVGRRTEAPGRHFVAITDPGTPLEKLAADRRFRRCFSAPPEVGGRYSALTVFGLVPAALVGGDVAGLLASARGMVARCTEAKDAARHPGLRLGAVLGELGRAGRDKVVFVPSPRMRPFPTWTEQLIAESLGKRGRGLVPVATVRTAAEIPSSLDVLLVHVTLHGERETAVRRALAARAAAGVPVVDLELGSPLDLGREFFRWEFAIAVCGAVLGVDPFDQPDVEHAKELARRAMDPTAPKPTSAPYGVPVDDGLAGPLAEWLASVAPGDYVAVQAFLAPSAATDAALERLVTALREQTGTVVTCGYGPRFLHSTGQLHKGGPPSGVFLQIVDEPSEDLPVPELGLSFGRIVRAQAEGDRGALEEKHRRLLVVNAGPRAAAGLDAIARGVGAPAKPGAG